jgi:hypothetical protein
MSLSKTPENNMEKFPAWLYMLIWPSSKDGRLKDAAKNYHLKFIFEFDDFPPACILEIKEGDFQVTPLTLVESKSLRNKKSSGIDGWVIGSFDKLIAVSWSLKATIGGILSRKIRIRGVFKFLKLLKIIGYKGPFSENQNRGNGGALNE